MCVDSVTGPELGWLVQFSNTSVCGQRDRARAGLASTISRHLTPVCVDSDRARAGLVSTIMQCRDLTAVL